MSIAESGVGLESTKGHQGETADLAQFHGRTLTLSFEKIRLLEPAVVRTAWVERNKIHVPLRRKVYRRILSEMTSAQQKGLSLKQLAEDLAARAPTDPEAALLLRDLWEVSNITERTIADHRPPEIGRLQRLAGELKNCRWGGEEVLF